MFFNNTSLPLERKAEASKLAPIHVVLDIDQTLASSWKIDEDQLLEHPRAQEWFKHNNAKALKPHVFSPGAIALLQYLSKIPNCKVSFFSSAIDDRNLLLVPQLLARANIKLNTENVEEKNYLIFSRSHLTPADKEDKKQKPGFHAQLKKNLNTVLTAYNNNSSPQVSATLASTVLIDNSYAFCKFNQEKNLLHIESITALSILLAGDDHPRPEVLAANSLFYAVGLLKTAMDMGRENLADNLYRLQSNHSNFFALSRIPRYYHVGLEELQKEMPSLTFYGSEMGIKKYLGAPTKIFSSSSSASASSSRTFSLQN